MPRAFYDRSKRIAAAVIALTLLIGLALGIGAARAAYGQAVRSLRYEIPPRAATDRARFVAIRAIVTAIGTDGTLALSMRDLYDRSERITVVVIPDDPTQLTGISRGDSVVVRLHRERGILRAQNISKQVSV